MNLTKYAAMSAAFVVAALGMASADSHEYVNATGDFLLVCFTHGSHPSLGGVCWFAGGVGEDAFGAASVSLADDLVNPTGGEYCQDLNSDSLCGDPAAGEPDIRFCGTVGLQDGVNWTPSSITWAFVNGPISGNPATSPCGAVSIGTHGFGTAS